MHVLSICCYVIRDICACIMSAAEVCQHVHTPTHTHTRQHTPCTPPTHPHPHTHPLTHPHTHSHTPTYPPTHSLIHTHPQEEEEARKRKREEEAKAALADFERSLGVADEPATAATAAKRALSDDTHHTYHLQVNTICVRHTLANKYAVDHTPHTSHTHAQHTRFPYAQTHDCVLS